MWAAIADMELPARLHPGLKPVSMHATAAFSIVLSLVFLEALRRYAAVLSFGYVLVLRTAWSIANAGSPIVDAMVAQLAHRSKEGYGRQRLWGSVAWAVMTLSVGYLMDVYGTDAMFACTVLAKSLLILAIVYAIATTTPRLHVPTSPLDAAPTPAPALIGGPTGESEGLGVYVRRTVHMLKACPLLTAVMATNLSFGFVTVILDNVTSMQAERDFKMSRTLNGLMSTVGIVCSVPCFFFSENLIARYGHFALLLGAQIVALVQLVLHSLVTAETAWLMVPICLLKGAVFSLGWSSSVEFLQLSVDPHLVSTAQTMLLWSFFTVGGGLGNIFWSAFYQAAAGPATYLAGAAMTLANILALRWYLSRRAGSFAGVTGWLWYVAPVGPLRVA